MYGEIQNLLALDLLTAFKTKLNFILISVTLHKLRIKKFSDVCRQT